MWKLKAIFSLVIVAILTCGVANSQDTEVHQPEHKFYDLGSFTLENGARLPKASLLYVTHGELNEDSTNAILLQTAFGGDHHGYDFLIGPELVLDPQQYYIIIAELFAAGGSSSPTNTAPPYDGPRFPEVSIRDNVRASHSLVTREFGLDHLEAVIGFSMGAQQAFQWAVSHPDFMDVIIPMCGAAKTYPHGKVRLQSVIDIIRADPGFRRGDFDSLTAATKKAWTSHWASWVFSQQWWRLELFKQRADTPEEFIGGMARSNSDSKIKDKLALSKTWINHDVGDTPGMGGDLEKALRSIKAKVWYLPGETDLYFPIEDATYEAQFIDDVVFRPVPSVWGHLACVGANPEDRQFLSEQIRQALAN